MSDIASNILKAINDIDPSYLIVGYYYLDYRLKYNYNNRTKAIITYSLKKDGKPLENIVEVLLPPELKINNRKIDFRDLLKKEFGKEITKFADIIINNFSSKNLINFYNNISELSIEKNNAFYKKGAFKRRKNTIGIYNVRLNIITILEEFASTSLPHELFHMASRFFDEVSDNLFCGFSQKTNNKNFGDGFNEGYTEYMVEKYYGDSYVEDTDYSYQLLRKIAATVEKIIGKEKMETLYLNANLKGLIDELTIYVGEQNAINFINCTDYLLKNINFQNKSKKQQEVLESNLRILNLFVLSLYTEYAAKKYNNKEIDFDEVKELMLEGIKNMYNVTINGTQYDAIPSAEFIAEICLGILRKNGIDNVSVEIADKDKIK